MRKCLYIMALMAGLASGAVLEDGTQLGASSGSNYYTVYFWSVDYTTLTINSTSLNVSGLNNTKSECWIMDSDLLAHDVGYCNLSSTNTAKNLVVHNVMDVGGEVTVFNVTGNLTNLTICYNSSGQSQLNFTLDDLGGDCNYGVFNHSSYTHNVNLTKFPRKLTDFTECYFRIQFNVTSQSATCMSVYEDESMSETSLTTLLAMVNATIILITRGYQWNSES